MTVESNIPVINKEGSAKKVLTDYQVHTISIVGEGALGINLTKLKGVSLDNKEGKALKEKLDKAKSLDAAEAVVEEITTEDVAITDAPEEVVKQKAAKEDEEVAEEVVEDKAKAAEEDEDLEEVVEKAKAEDEEAEEEDSEEMTEKAKAEEEEEDPEMEVEKDAKKSVAAKMLTMEEHVEASKSSLDAISNLVMDIKSKAPEADAWEVFQLINDIVWKLDCAQWAEDEAMRDKVWQQVWDETSSRVEKSKALKVAGERSFEDKLKALELIDPSLAELARSERSKALKLEADLKASVRAKALEKGAETYKRISTEDNTTDAIVDAMLHIEQLAPEQHTVIAKALAVAANITMAGDLFRDTGSTEEQLQLSPEEYVDTKAKALVEAKGGKTDDKSALAAARANIRQTAEFAAIYG